MASVPALTSYSNALVLLASPRINCALDTLRRAHDKAHPRWAAHITLLFPFCGDEDIPTASRLLRHALAAKDGQPSVEPFEVHLGQVGRFSQDTIYLAPSAGDVAVKALWKRLSAALNYSGRDFVPHMTLGQGLRQREQVDFLTRKGEKLVEQDLRWMVDRVCILRKNESLGGKMEVLEEIPFGVAQAGELVSPHSLLTTETTYHFQDDQWSRSIDPISTVSLTNTLTVATYNILHDDAHPSSSRLQPIVRAILQGNADVMCLQEVTDEFLPMLLQHPDIIAKYPWSNRAPNTVMESDRNIVILAREGLPFTWKRVNLSSLTKHKAACVASIQFESQPSIAVASVHLTAGLGHEHIAKKSLELATLLTYLQIHHSNDQWIISGDTNWPDMHPFPHSEDLLDVWSGGLGATYDPSANSLADATAREDRSPQRYDRILVGRKGSSPLVISTSLFGMPEYGDDPPSDHWGLTAVLEFGASTTDAAPSQPAVAVARPIPTSSSSSVADSNLAAVAESEGWLPSPAQTQKMQTAVDTLRALFAGPAPTSREDQEPSDTAAPPTPSSSAVVKLFVVPVGGYALGVHTSHSDLDCLVVGNINPHTFWAVAKSRIRTWSKTNPNGADIKLRRFVKDAAVQMMELSVGGIEVDIQYSLAPRLTERWNELSELPSDSPEFLLPMTSLKSLNAHRDALALNRAMQPFIEAFRLAHRSIKLFCTRRGLMGSRFGYLGGFHITLLLSRVALRFPASERSSVTASQLINAFFHEYSQFNWEKDIAAVDFADSSTPASASTYRRTPNREPMVILSIEKPAINVTAHASQHSMAAISREFARANEKLSSGASWAEVVGSSDSGVRDFLDGFKLFVKVEVSYWGSSCMKGRALEGWLESRFISLLVQLNTQLPDIHAKLWPARFTDASMADEESRDIHGFYLIGLSPLQPSSVPEDEQQKAAKNTQIRATLLNVLRSFEEFTHNNQRYYDQGEMFVALSDVKRSTLGSSVVLDNHQWADGGFDDEDGDEGNAADSDDTEEDETIPSEDLGFVSSASRKRKIKEAKAKTTHVPAPMKLRTSVDVLNRLSWDPRVVKEDYVIGYEDRFKGIKEMPLASWKREVEDEAFIPFHRVVYFKRKSDETLVWDRKTKTDMIFGSGAGVI